ncbi:23S rRNA (cytidine(2498)-2'-O)-methyltransferase RlmM [Glaciecola petra]|uniref:23S rRNA (Cytidine(2498)-2'-O)-methyltransferase RlmM n=1 Tax=Glaciecola petra TaxID=3075602 RepID=A0ABU2ZNY5_9ALTE|nr:23S rRNA (cytidine(2498)-2'-O)-methyltransferase RlmM [Aestuariibacter sp. P117]MDT0594110.1 23S rRNA (cytidine(2498)-2'-O)-methyltransferase RlmM [Aestuariibacter sp. P117]
MELIFYCRSGYEADLLAELQDKLAINNHYGYGKFNKNDALVRFHLNKQNPDHIQSINEITRLNAKLPKFSELIFARQKLFLLSDIAFKTDNRVAEILAYLQMACPKQSFSEVFVEYAENEKNKKIAKFCKKFLVPLRTALRKLNLLTPIGNDTKSSVRLHAIFETSANCTLAISIVNDSSSNPMGIKRLKMPQEAPSRSTLKLEEALLLFFSQNQQTALFTKGMRAVDLGACPGGWTYQLIKRNIIVEAVDHGEIAENLLQTGLVEYYSQDGFLYEPQQGNVDWLVCDMLEQPSRVADLMLKWLVSRKANAAIFNLKLPMAKRYKVVSVILQNIKNTLSTHFEEYHFAAKQLYHNRDEISIVIITNTQLLKALAKPN